MNIDNSLEHSKPVFFDNKGKRWKIFNYASLAVAITTTVLVVFFIISVLINPFLPQIRLKPLAILPQLGDTKLSLPDALKPSRRDPQLKRMSDQVKTEKAAREELKKEQSANRAALFSKPAPTPPAAANVDGKPLAIGFYVNWEDSSYASLKENINALD